MEANEEWIKLFPEAKVFHRSMAASDHCLLSLSFKMRGARRGFRRDLCLKRCGLGMRDAEK